MPSFLSRDLGRSWPEVLLLSYTCCQESRFSDVQQQLALKVPAHHDRRRLLPPSLDVPICPHLCRPSLESCSFSTSIVHARACLLVRRLDRTANRVRDFNFGRGGKS